MPHENLRRSQKTSGFYIFLPNIGHDDDARPLEIRLGLRAPFLAIVGCIKNGPGFQNRVVDESPDGT
jgi:hypothetical protein